jgi:hypothetical protein
MGCPAGIMLAAPTDNAIDRIVSTHQKQQQDARHQVGLVLIERQVRAVPLLFIRKLAQVAVYL